MIVKCQFEDRATAEPNPYLSCHTQPQYTAHNQCNVSASQVMSKNGVSPISGFSTGPEPVPFWVPVAAEPINDVDTTVAEMLVDLDEELNATGIHLIFAELKDPVRAKIERYGLQR